MELDHSSHSSQVTLPVIYSESSAFDDDMESFQSTQINVYGGSLHTQDFPNNISFVSSTTTTNSKHDNEGDEKDEEGNDEEDETTEGENDNNDNGEENNNHTTHHHKFLMSVLGVKEDEIFNEDLQFLIEVLGKYDMFMSNK